ncbi:substrate-binding domain-containing protein [Erwiniaceae bacterium BAC15a-03b]|uniref:Substrate-binding domain-containing protein n=1 Tax=Winslowiella arboricola TaxID=2978220 RepID=A0A9J6PZG6_9GAMM|nr:substrate-binding domain-containing protein [Winslowiella arboricola]MCU5775287.1 substrate-binding domain-containing protein [Winslowiella arboricola]MCU5780316.1 substrate-binding domain-containing protein [Winslowiella arboricola]
MNNTTEQQKANIIGVVSNTFSNPYSVKMLNELTCQLNARGYITLLLNIGTRDSLRQLLQMARPLQIDGLVFLAPLSSDELITTAVGLPDVPAICLGNSHHNGDMDVVSADDYAAGVEIGQLLLSQGHQRFGFMQQQDDSPAHLQRLEGYISSLDAAHKTLDKVLVAGSNHREQAYQAMTAYLKQARASERIDALFCENDLLAFGAMQAIRDFGQAVHIGVVGYDDVDEARSSTWHLTSWAPRGDLQIAEALNRLLDNRSDNHGGWRQGELQVRHSHLGKEVPGEMAKCGCASRH